MNNYRVRARGGCISVIVSLPPPPGIGGMVTMTHPTGTNCRGLIPLGIKGIWSQFRMAYHQEAGA